MTVAGVDLNWGDETQGRVAVALVDHGRTVTVTTGLSDDGLFALLSAARPQMVTLDIPIDGCEGLSMQVPTRLIDRVLAGQGVPVLPSYKAGMRGAMLRDRIRSLLGRETPVYEVYPYGTYKVLAYATPIDRSSPQDSAPGDGFRQWWPPKYKRALVKRERILAMVYLRRLLMHPDFGLTFHPPLPHPGQMSMDALGDAYDACLAAMPALYWLSREPFTCLAGSPSQGEMLLIAHPWLQKAIAQHVPMRTP
jgi:predicted nuclease with RNAse H fold